MAFTPSPDTHGECGARTITATTIGSNACPPSWSTSVTRNSKAAALATLCVCCGSSLTKDADVESRTPLHRRLLLRAQRSRGRCRACLGDLRRTQTFQMGKNVPTRGTRGRRTAERCPLKRRRAPNKGDRITWEFSRELQPRVANSLELSRPFRHVARVVRMLLRDLSNP